MYTDVKLDGNGGFTAKRGNLNLSGTANADNGVYREILELEAAGEITIAPYVAPPPPTSAELDALADQVAAQMLDDDAQMKALGLVMADLIEKAFGVTQATARQQVKTRFRNYYRGLIG